METGEEAVGEEVQGGEEAGGKGWRPRTVSADAADCVNDGGIVEVLHIAGLWADAAETLVTDWFNQAGMDQP